MSTIFGSSAEDSLVYVCYQIYPENAEIVRYVAIVTTKGPNTLFSVNSTEIQ